jgi:parallel beta-helix repeat protein
VFRERVTGAGIKVEDCDNVTVSGNTCFNNTVDGIQVRNTSAAPTNTVISGNVANGNTVDGIHIIAGLRVNVSGNQVHGNGRNGIRMFADTGDTIDDVLIANNHCMANGADALESDIRVNGGSGTYGTIIIRGNFCDGAGTGTHGIDIEETTFTAIRVEDNYVANHATAELVTVAGVYLKHVGAGTPHATHTAAKGSMWYRTDGGTSTTLYVNEAGDTNWVAVVLT